ncbi:winged helix-turn-helix domain-containing protein [Roseateles depolymerans]|nr:winged helix-turn-helix domain-containing protein [Roseateles depolymerans]
MHLLPTHSSLEINPMASADTARETGPRSPFSASIVSRAADLSLDKRHDFVDRLRDPLQRFAPDVTLTLVTLMREAASSYPSVIHWPWVVWCEPGQPIQTPDPQRAHCVLLMPAFTNTGWELHAALASELGAGQATLPAHLPPYCRYDCRSHDIFDVIMQTLQRADPERRFLSSRDLSELASPPGLPLRRALAQWLETLPTIRRPVPCRPQAAMLALQARPNDQGHWDGTIAHPSPLGVSLPPPGLFSLGDDMPMGPWSGWQMPSQPNMQGQRAQAMQGPASLRFNGLTIDLVKQEVLVGTRPVALTNTEYSILLTLAQMPGRGVSRQALKGLLTGCKLALGERAVDQHIVRIRRKLMEANPDHDWIGTHRGNGYVFVDRA